jgi:hypothetical protein
MKEVCNRAPSTNNEKPIKASGKSFVNVYWVSAGKHVLKSSQWVSETVGSLVIQNLRL